MLRSVLILVTVLALTASTAAFSLTLHGASPFLSKPHRSARSFKTSVSSSPIHCTEAIASSTSVIDISSLPSSSSPPKPSPDKIPLTKENIQFFAGVWGTILLSSHPFIGASLFNYASRTQSDETFGAAVNTLSSSSLEAFNYLANLDDKYGIVEKAKDRVLLEYDSFKDSNTVVERRALENLEQGASEMAETLMNAAEQVSIQDLARQALQFAGDVNEKVLSKWIEVNKDYEVLKKGMDGLKKMVGGIGG
jgi:hypothetical protein